MSESMIDSSDTISMPVSNGAVPAVLETQATVLENIVASEQEWSPYAEDQINARPQVWTRGLLYFLITFEYFASSDPKFLFCYSYFFTKILFLGFYMSN